METSKSVFEERVGDDIDGNHFVIAQRVFPLTQAWIGKECIPVDPCQRFSAVGQASEGGVHFFRIDRVGYTL